MLWQGQDVHDPSPPLKKCLVTDESNGKRRVRDRLKGRDGKATRHAKVGLIATIAPAPPWPALSGILAAIGTHSGALFLLDTAAEPVPSSVAAVATVGRVERLVFHCSPNQRRRR